MVFIEVAYYCIFAYKWTTLKKFCQIVKFSGLLSNEVKAGIFTTFLKIFDAEVWQGCVWKVHILMYFMDFVMFFICLQSRFIHMIFFNFLIIMFIWSNKYFSYVNICCNFSCVWIWHVQWHLALIIMTPFNDYITSHMTASVFSKIGKNIYIKWGLLFEVSKSKLCMHVTYIIWQIYL